MNPENPYQQPSGQQPTPAQHYTVPGSVPPVAPGGGYAPIQPASVPPIHSRPQSSKLWLILTIVFIFTTIAASGVGIWAYINYNDQKSNVDSIASERVAVAVKDQADKDAAAFLEKEKQPNRQYVGPDDYGRLSFDYPKTWSVYVQSDASDGGEYQAYFNPGVVPSVTSSTQQFALRVSIQELSYDQVVQTYDAQVQTGDLVASSVKADEQNGQRLDGKFSENVVGSAVIFKIRDKTVTIRTDAQVFKGDFDALIQTITFNK